jgi:cytochrome c oxidase subunit 1
MYSSVVFSFLTVFIAVPTAVKIMNWTFTLHGGNVIMASPMLYAIGFIGLFTVGGMTGLFLASMGMDVPLHDTYFVVAHFHFTMVGGMTMAFLAGLHFWWPKLFGRMYPEFLAKFAAIVIFVGFNCTFFPQFIVGWLGMPRRYHTYPEEWQVLNVMSTAGSAILGVGFLIAMGYLAWSVFYGRPAGPNPWGAKGLEWEVCTSPPHPHNFTSIPVVTEEPYSYTGEEVLDID